MEEETERAGNEEVSSTCTYTVLVYNVLLLLSDCKVYYM